MLNHGQEYIEAKPAIHIGFLDYTLFNGCPEFYATYKLMNVKNHHIYSDNLTLSVVDLSHIDLATKEDKAYHIDYWAKLFKATTWEEIKMLAAKDPYIDEASQSIFYMTTDEQVRRKCRDREDYYAHERAREQKLAEQDKKIAERDKKLTERDKIIAEQDKTIAKDKKTITKQDKIIAEKDKTISEKDVTIRDLLAKIEQLEADSEQ